MNYSIKWVKKSKENEFDGIFLCSVFQTINGTFWNFVYRINKTIETKVGGCEIISKRFPNTESEHICPVSMSNFKNKKKDSRY